MVTDKRKQYLHFFLFVFPACLVCMLFIVYPFFRGVYGAFTDTDWSKNTPVHYTCMENFAEIFDPVKNQRFLPWFTTHYLFKDNYELPITIESTIYKNLLLARIKNTKESVLLEKAYPIKEKGHYILDNGYKEFVLYDRLMVLSGNDHARYSIILNKIRTAAFSGLPPGSACDNENWVASSLDTTLSNESTPGNFTDSVDDERSGLLKQYYNVFTVKKILSTYMYKKEFMSGVLGFTLLYTLINLLIANPIALLLALALDRKVWAARIARLLIVLPTVLSALTVSFLGLFIFEKVFPFVTGTDGWLDSSQRAPLLIAFVGVWRNCGFLVLIYLAGLQTIPGEYREAATLESRNIFQIFMKVTGPLLFPFLALGLFWTLASSFQVFDMVFGLTRVSAYSTDTASWMLDIYINAYTGNRVGYAMAKALLLGLLCAGFSFGQYYAMKKQGVI